MFPNLNYILELHQDAPLDAKLSPDVWWEISDSNMCVNKGDKK